MEIGCVFIIFGVLGVPIPGVVLIVAVPGLVLIVCPIVVPELVLNVEEPPIE